MKKDLAPIVLFVYCRLSVTIKTINALKNNPESCDSDLYIYSDSAKNENSVKGVSDVRDYIRSITGFKNITIIERDKNWGLAKNLIDGITTIVNRYGKIVVLEDDTVVAPNFLEFMNNALVFYKDNDKIGTISAYNYNIKGLPSVYLSRFGSCWGWATWSRAWSYFNADSSYLLEKIKKNNCIKEFNDNDTYPYFAMLKKQNEGLINSWAIRWQASCFLNGLLHVRVGNTLVQNCGFNVIGSTHSAPGSLNVKDTFVKLQYTTKDFEKSKFDKEANAKTQDYQISIMPFGLKLILLAHKIHADGILSKIDKKYSWNR